MTTMSFLFNRNTRRIGATLLVAAAAIAADRPAFADKATAEALFEKGRKLMEDGKADQACPKFAESYRADPSPGAMLNLARCHETIGKTASAWAEYKQSVTLLRTANRGDAADAAQKFADDLEPKLSKLEIDAAETPSGFEVHKDAEVLGTGSLGVALAIDPGEHTVEAKAPGYKPFTTKVTIGKEKDLQKVQIPALEKLPPDQVAATQPTPTQGGAQPAGGAATTAPAPQGSSTMRTAGLVMGGVGIVGLGLGTVFGILASSDASGAKNDSTLCPNKVCSPAGRAQIDSANTKAIVSTIGFIGGGVLLAGGAVLYLVSGPKNPAKQEHASTQLIPAVGPQGGGLSLVGRF